ncbi:hypothetical protein BDW59DRAFT_59542 [Aspergillus cavernicola]|uniref:REJ domain-containing protein n=1 Tax=Aspergillus cavernicola TaxID=176166 RepID=A0ABR4IGX5_9EURO
MGYFAYSVLISYLTLSVPQLLISVVTLSSQSSPFTPFIPIIPSPVHPSSSSSSHPICLLDSIPLSFYYYYYFALITLYSPYYILDGCLCLVRFVVYFLPV